MSSSWADMNRALTRRAARLEIAVACLPGQVEAPQRPALEHAQSVLAAELATVAAGIAYYNTRDGDLSSALERVDELRHVLGIGRAA